MTLRVLIADDHPVVTRGLSRHLEAQDRLRVVDVARTLPQAVVLATMLHPHVVTLDIQMPGFDGPASVEAITAVGADVVLFSLTEDPALIHGLVEAGAAAFVSKSADPDELVAAVLGAAAKRDALGPRPPLPHEGLSEREKAVFQALIRSQTPKEIAFGLNLSASTVYTYAERVRAKLGLRSQHEMVRYATALGLVDE